MKIYKFGGASVQDAAGVKNISSIIEKCDDKLVVVVSAMGKTTDLLEQICNSYFRKGGDSDQIFQQIQMYHWGIIGKLFGEDKRPVMMDVNKLFDKLLSIIQSEPSLSYDYEYDRIISFGELISTTIVAAYLKYIGKDVTYVDIRKSLFSDENYRNANIDMELSGKRCRETFSFANTSIYITQGFIAGTTTNQTTTLGREGSDYTAALLANILEAKDVSIWKDVPGIMSADPKVYNDVRILPFLSYREAIELSNYGAKVIHPKTIKPLENKHIPLYVKSFVSPTEPGTVICDHEGVLELPPIYINKNNLVLLTLTPRDFSFIAEERLGNIMNVLAKYRIKLNVIQNSAISFSFCIDNNEAVFGKFIDEVKNEYKVLYNSNVRLITIRHYNEVVIHKLTEGKKILMEQRSRRTARFIIEEE